jgi:putative ABC transport system permease protein
MGTLWQDVRYGVRMLGRSPGFSVIVVVLVAIGVGASTTVFSILNPILLRPLPYAEPDRIVNVGGRTQEGYNWNVSYPDYLDWRRQATSFDELACVTFRNCPGSVRADEPPRECCLGFVSDNFFRVFGVQPVVGRFFTPEDDRPGAAPVVVLGHAFWQRYFAAEPNALGRSLLLDSVSYAIIGVTPAGFDYLPYGADTTDVWVPVAPSGLSKGGRGNRILEVLAKVKAGVSVVQARAEMEAICGRLAAQYASDNAGRSASVMRLHEAMKRPIRHIPVALMGTVLMVFLVACANVAGLMFARGVTREREMALRAAVGGTRLRLMRLMLLENVLLALVGGWLGVLGAAWTIRLLLATGVIPSAQFPAGFFDPDRRAVGFALALSVLAVPVCSLLPSLSCSRVSLARLLAAGGRSVLGSRGRNAAHTALLAVQAALTIVLLVAAGLMIRSLTNLVAADRGFDPRNLLTLDLQLTGTCYDRPESRLAFHQQLLDQLGALAGIEKAALTQSLFGGWSWGFRVEGEPPVPPGQREETATYKFVSPGYFEAMRIPLLRGRCFEERDRLASAPVVIVDQTLAARYWPEGDWVGRRLQTNPGDPNAPWVEVIGVVGHVKNEAKAGPQMQIYQPLFQKEQRKVSVVLRTARDPMSFAAAVQSMVHQMDRQQLICAAHTLDEYLWFDTLIQRFITSLLSAFAGVGLLLSATGIYAITRYSISRRTQEFGIRIALGANRRDVLKLVLRKGLMPVFIGAGIGLGGTIAVARVLSSLLYQLSPWDPVTYVAVSLLLGGVALLAGYLPARRATRIDPMVALRYE